MEKSSGPCVLSDLQDIDKAGDTRAAAAAADVCVRDLLVSGSVSETSGATLSGCSCMAAPPAPAPAPSAPAPAPPAPQTHQCLMMPSRGSCLTLAPNQFPPNCGRSVWLWYQLVWGTAGRQERIKRGYKQRREDGSMSLSVVLFHYAAKQARPKNA